ncbi:MAG TPA: NUDIX domain-containing protein [Anaerolineales bacterium]|jgi:8-oxo-dGTP diphosphatase
MPKSDQGVTPQNYSVVPRTAIFLRRDGEYLLLKGASDKRLWPNLYNCLGGHVRSGEDVRSAAARELFEEAGLEADLWLGGTLVVDSGPIGVCLFIFLGDYTGGQIVSSREGEVHWVAYEQLAGLPHVEDLPALVDEIHKMRRGDEPFSARSSYDEHTGLSVIFAK